MKKFLTISCLFLAVCTNAETIQMKDGNFITGSIASQTEYILKLITSFGTITLNQKEIEAILPDKHRVILKGGSQLIGQIMDLDEFNLKLKTDDGAVVNIDRPQIVSVEAYDYDRGPDAQKEYVAKTQARQAEKQATTAAGTVPAGVTAAGGLTFDNDIDQVFDAQKATVVNGQVVTSGVKAVPVSQPMSDEEAFAKGVKTGAVSQQEYAQAAKEELAAQKNKKVPQAEKKAPKLHNEAAYNKYFSVQAGVMPLNLKLDNSSRPGFSGDSPYNVGGTSITVSSKFLWRIKGSRLWLGPELGIGSIANHSFPDKDPDPSITEPNPEVKTSGQILRAGATAHFYLTPKSRFAFYLTGSALYEVLHLNYRGELQSDRISSSGLAGAAGLGVETWLDDLMVGLEVREVFSQRQNELKKSSSANTLIQAQLSWKF